MILYRLGTVSRAAISLDCALLSHDRPPLAVVVRAYLAIERGELASAWDDVEKLCTSSAGATDATGVTADLLIESGLCHDARRLLNRHLERFPWDTEALLARSATWHSEGEMTEALRDLDAVLCRYPGHAVAIADRALISAEEGGASELTLRAAQAAARSEPRAVRVRVALAVVQSHLGRVDEARATVRALVRLAGHTAEVRLVAGMVELGSGDHRRALRLLGDGAAGRPSVVAERAFARALAHLLADDPTQGREQLAACLRVRPTHVEALALRAMLDRDRDPLSAHADASKVLDLQPHHVGACGVLAATLLVLDRPHEAAEQCARALSRHPQSVELLLLAGYSAGVLGRSEDLRRDLDRLVGLVGPDDVRLQPLREAVSALERQGSKVSRSSEIWRVLSRLDLVRSLAVDLF